MAEPEAKPRRRFQLHLSTCVILTIVAGLLVWANAVPRQIDEGEWDMTRWAFMERGWPWSFHERQEIIEARLASIHAWVSGDNLEGYQPRAWALKSAYALADGLVALTILVVIAAACEGWIARRKRKREGAE